jgi:hypothetical protein
MVFFSLVTTSLLYLSERFQWFSFNQHKGWTVLIAVAAVGVVLLLMLAWLGVALMLRRRFQFNLRSLLLLVVAVALPCSWLAVEMKRAREQHECLVGITRLHGEFFYDYLYLLRFAVTPYSVLPPAHLRQFSRAPSQLEGLRGRDFFADVLQVDLERTGPGASEALRQVRGLKQLLELEVGDVDHGLDNLRELTELRSLKCTFGWSDCMTDELKELRGLTRLESFEVSNITDEGLANLEPFQGLEVLTINACDYTDAGLRHIGKLHKLTSLVLNQAGGAAAPITDAGLQYLRSLHLLKSLGLFGTEITDAGLIQLTPLAKLRSLDLSFTQITDAGLSTLAGFSQLEELNLRGTEVSEDGVKKLQNALPKCMIEH